MDLTVVVPSLGRPNCRESLALFTDPLLCIPESQAEQYRFFNPRTRILVHPDSMIGMARKRQFILDKVSTEAVFMADDDLVAMVSLVGNTTRHIDDPASIFRLLAGTALCAKEAGTVLFGYQHTVDTRHFDAMTPFSFSGYIDGSAFGVVGRDRRLRFDSKLTCSLDIDYSLQVLFHRRILWRDNRFAFSTYNRFRKVGGMSTLRTAATVATDQQILKAKWGPAIDFDRYKRRGKAKQQNIRIHVKR